VAPQDDESALQDEHNLVECERSTLYTGNQQREECRRHKEHDALDAFAGVESHEDSSSSALLDFDEPQRVHFVFRARPPNTERHVLRVR